MRVAILAPVTWRTPPRNYGPWEQVASVLAEALVALGVDVTLFASGDSVTAGQLKWVIDRPVGECPRDAKVAECLHISNLMEQADDFDIIHNHFDFLPLTYSGLIRTPVITTIHGFSSPEIIPVFKRYNGHTHYVSISDSDRHAELDYIGTVYNGLDDQLFHAGGGDGGYLLYFGRIHPHKGTHEAILIARDSGMRLLICGLIQDQAYFNEWVAPYVDGEQVMYLGNAGPEQRDELMGRALGLLHPISFEEPFGLSVAEAMLCGTPVIAFDRGAMGELIVDEKTGFLVQDVAGAVGAVRRLSFVRREDCRAHALAHFSGGAMAKRYLGLYEQILGYRGSLSKAID